MAHITGGGFVENLPRVIPPHLSARLVTQSWDVPPLFQQLVVWSGMALAEAYRVFNMGMGMVLIVAAEDAAPILDLLPEAIVIGRLAERADDQPALQLILE